MPRSNKINQSGSKIQKNHRSVSLEYDYISEAFSRPFVLTGCANRATRRILEGLAEKGGARAWTLTGPFGTGKSSFALFLSQLLGNPVSSMTRNARDTLSKADDTLNSMLHAAIPRGKGLAAIVVTGAREPLHVAINRALSASLEQSSAQGASRLAKEIRESKVDARYDPLKLLQRTINCLTAEASTVGVSIIIDELGKLLEYAATNPKHSDVYLLQRIAEYASRAEIPTLLIGILHQDFAGYAHDLSENDRREWDKVRGRFEDIIFEQSADDMLRLIADAMSNVVVATPTPPKTENPKFATLCKNAWPLKLVPPGLEQSRGLSLLSKCHPLHPSATLLLGPIFKRFGQNERSAFSFLSSGEPHALTDFARRANEGELYRIVDLYEYLFSVFGDTLLVSRDGKRWAEAFNVEAQHPDLTADELKLLRTIALLGIVGRWNGVSPTPAVLQFALAPAMTPADFDKAIKGLQAKSAIVFRRFNGTYNLWEGSDIDVEARIADMRSQIAADVSTVQLLASHFSPRPLLARRHSYETGTLRYFDVTFVTSTTIADALARFEAMDDGERADGLILVTLPNSRGVQVNPTDPLLQAITARPDIIVCAGQCARAGITCPRAFCNRACSSGDD